MTNEIGGCGHFCEACARRDDKIKGLIAERDALAASHARLLAEIISLREDTFTAASMADGTVPDEIDREELARLDGIIAGAKP